MIVKAGILKFGDKCSNTLLKEYNHLDKCSALLPKKDMS